MFLTKTPRFPDPTEEMTRLAENGTDLLLLGGLRPFDTVFRGDKRYGSTIRPGTDGHYLTINEELALKSSPAADRLATAAVKEHLQSVQPELDVVLADQMAEHLRALIERFAKSVREAILVIDPIFGLKDEGAEHLAAAMQALQEADAFGVLLAPTLRQSHSNPFRQHHIAYGETREMERFNDRLIDPAPTIECGVSDSQRGLLVESGWQIHSPGQYDFWNNTSVVHDFFEACLEGLK